MVGVEPSQWRESQWHGCYEGQRGWRRRGAAGAFGTEVKVEDHIIFRGVIVRNNNHDVDV
jgi:hypothetical protein